MPLESIPQQTLSVEQPTLLVELFSLVINKADHLNNFWLCHSSGARFRSTHLSYSSQSDKEDKFNELSFGMPTLG